MNEFPKPHWPGDEKGIYARGYFQQFVIACLWQRVNEFSTMPEIKNPLEAGLTELQLENVFQGLEPGDISRRLRAMQSREHIELAPTCHLWRLGKRQLDRIAQDRSNKDRMEKFCK